MPTGGPPPPGYSLDFDPDGIVSFVHHPYDSPQEKETLTVTAKNGTELKIDPATGEVLR